MAEPWLERLPRLAANYPDPLAETGPVVRVARTLATDPATAAAMVDAAWGALSALEVIRGKMECLGGEPAEIFLRLAIRSVTQALRYAGRGEIDAGLLSDAAALFVAEFLDLRNLGEGRLIWTHSAGDRPEARARLRQGLAERMTADAAVPSAA